MIKTSQKITPFLWFAREAEEAAQFYTTVFKDSRITNVNRYGPDAPGPEGTAMVVEFELEGQEFMAINGGEAAAEGFGRVAFYVDCETQAEADRLWDALLAGGKEMQCGWLTDKFGLAWNIVPHGLTDYLAGDDEAGSRRAMQEMLSQVKLNLEAIRRAYEGR